MRKLEIANAKIAVCITTHMRDYPRREGGNIQEHVDFFKWSIDRYLAMSHGVKEVDLLIMDTGSEDQQYLDYISDVIERHDNVYLIKTPNRCAYLAGIKHVMEGRKDIIDKYDYFMFHVDDSIDPQYDNWARELVDQFHSNKEDKKIIGISDEIHSPRDYGNLGHARFWPWGQGLESIYITFVHGPFYFMDRMTLISLKKGWTKQCYSEDLTSCMEEMSKYENMDYVYLKDSNFSFIHSRLQEQQCGRTTPKNIDVIKEHELNVRFYYLGITPIRYTGSRIRYNPVSDRLTSETDSFY
jgi:hypothetical protein